MAGGILLMGEDEMDLGVLFLGRCQYDRALDIQYEILEKRQEGQIGDTLIIVEHPPVITLGRNAVESNIMASEEFLNSQGISLCKTNRGGDVTYHGDGQIVGYPIVNLRERKMGIKEFVARMENAFIDLLKNEFAIGAGKDEKHTGVWVGHEKIVAIGLAVKRRTTMHGFAFNINTNLEHFKYIVPCGIVDKGVTSLEKITGGAADLDRLKKLTVDYLYKSLGYEARTVYDLDQLTMVQGDKAVGS